MKSLLLANVSFFISIFSTVIFLRLNTGKTYFRLFIFGYILGATFYSLAYLLFLPDILSFTITAREGATIVGYCYGLVIFSLLFSCFVNVIYSAVLTGITTHILYITHCNGMLKLSDIPAMFGVTTDKDKMLERRLDFLSNHNYILVEKTGFRLSIKGKCIANIHKICRNLFRIEEVG